MIFVREIILLRFGIFGTLLNAACKMDPKTHGFSSRKLRKINGNLFRKDMCSTLIQKWILVLLWMVSGSIWGPLGNISSPRHRTKLGFQPNCDLKWIWGGFCPGSGKSFRRVEGLGRFGQGLVAF